MSAEAMPPPSTGKRSGSVTGGQMPAQPCRYVCFKAEADNAGKVYVGPKETLIWPLGPGEESGWLPCEDLSEFHYRTTDAGDSFTYLLLV